VCECTGGPPTPPQSPRAANPLYPLSRVSLRGVVPSLVACNPLVTAECVLLHPPRLVQMILKMVAMNVIGRNSYFADPWNWVDFVVVFVGFLSLFPSVHNFSAMRIFRVLRPLRTLTSIPSMRVRTLWHSKRAVSRCLPLASLGY
jgi:hypothetical protein